MHLNTCLVTEIVDHQDENESEDRYCMAGMINEVEVGYT
jgi:hypothetical protein